MCVCVISLPLCMCALTYISVCSPLFLSLYINVFRSLSTSISLSPRAEWSFAVASMTNTAGQRTVFCLRGDNRTHKTLGNFVLNE